MRRRARPEPEPEASGPMDRIRVRYALARANELREAGESLHHHPIMDALVKATGNPLAVYVFIRYPDEYKLSSADLAELADGLLEAHGATPPTS